MPANVVRPRTYRCIVGVFLLAIINAPFVAADGLPRFGQNSAPALPQPPQPLPTDVDPQLTRELDHAEQELCDAILHRDMSALDGFVASNFTLRVADVPQGSLPRAVWMENTRRITGRSCDRHHLTARRLTDDLAAVSLVWSQEQTADGRDFSGEFYVVDFWTRSSGRWRIAARYSAALGKIPERRPMQLPPPADVDPQLTETLRLREQQFAEASMHGDFATVDRIMGSEFTLRVGDAPERSVPRALRNDIQPRERSAYKIRAIEERFQAARKLSESLAVMSLLLTQDASLGDRDRSGDFYVVDIWRKSGDDWQIIARYSTPSGKKFDRSPAARHE
jgi:Domain of unknown function (DUF4440)